MVTPIIQAEGLTKVYKIRKRTGGWLRSFVAPETIHVTALEDASFSIQPGELVGYIAPNGAGKSTTVKILSGILTPDGGSCSVLGMIPWLHRKQVVSNIGVVFGQRSQLWWDLPVIDSFMLIRDIYRVDQSSYQKTLDALVESLTLAPLLHTPVRQLSLGQRMRCELAASLLHSPPILFLDEPTIGLDATSKLAVRDFIKARNRDDGVTVILTTHDMDDVEALCSRVMLIGQGRILMDGSIADLLSERHERRITATLERSLSDDTCLPQQVQATHVQGNEWTFRFDPDVVPAASVIGLLNEHCGIVDVMVENPPIDEVIAHRYRQMKQEAAL